MASQPRTNDSASGAAAASLWAAMSEGSSAPQDATPSAAAASSSAEDDIFEAPPAVDAPSSTGDPWRLKFLARVGIEGAAQAGPGSDEVGLGPPLPDSPVSSGVDRVDSVESDIDSTETVVVRTMAPPRTNDSIRAGYIRKLEASKASIPQLSRPKQAQVVTIFDWDDTLLCTTHLEMVRASRNRSPRRAPPIHHQIHNQFYELELPTPRPRPPPHPSPTLPPYHCSAHR